MPRSHAHHHGFRGRGVAHLAEASSGTEAAEKGYQARKAGDLASAREHYTVAAERYKEQGAYLNYAHTIRHIADIYQQEDNTPAAKPIYEEALAIYRSNPDTDPLDFANTVRPYALLVEKLGDSAFALKLWEEARNLYASLRLAPGVSECSEHIAHLQP